LLRITKLESSAAIPGQVGYYLINKSLVSTHLVCIDIEDVTNLVINKVLTHSKCNNTGDGFFIMGLENIMPEGYGFRGKHIYINYMLLQKARTLPELSIKTMEQWRVWLELKRVQGEIKILMNKKNLDQGTILKGFQINDINFQVNNEEIIIVIGEEQKSFSHHYLAYNLRGLMKEIFGRRLRWEKR
jgi:hypothetical protein